MKKNFGSHKVIRICPDPSPTWSNPFFSNPPLIRINIRVIQIDPNLTQIWVLQIHTRKFVLGSSLESEDTDINESQTANKQTNKLEIKKREKDNYYQTLVWILFFGWATPTRAQITMSSQCDVFLAQAWDTAARTKPETNPIMLVPLRTFVYLLCIFHTRMTTRT